MDENKKLNDTSSQKILLIEDDPFMREMIVLLLQAENYEVTGVESGSEALEMLQECTYSAIISDMYLPDTDGFTLFAQITFAYPDLLFLILTSETDETIVTKAAKLGIPYILKDENFAEAVLAAFTNVRPTATAGNSGAQMPAKLLHDLSQPLNSIKMTAGGILFLLKQGKKLPDEEIIECMNSISAQADLLAGIIKNLTLLIRPDKHSQLD